MSAKDVHPKWWQLYLTFLLLIVLFAVDSRLKISTRGHQIVQIGIVVTVFGLIYLWVKANSTALSSMDREQYSGKVAVIQVSPYSLSDNEKQVLLHLPDAEIQGVLDDTFETDIIDAEALPVEEIPQELNKE